MADRLQPAHRPQRSTIADVLPAPISTDSVTDSAVRPAATPDVRTTWYERVSLMHLSWLIISMSGILALAFLATPVHSGLRGLVQMVETAGALERVALWQRSVLSLIGADSDATFVSLPAGVLAYVVRLAYVGMFIVQGWAFWLAWKGTSIPFWKWMVGPIGAHLMMLLMPPSNADVFFYEITGNLANEGVNPYVHAMSEFPNNPLLPYNHWVDMTAVYGPVWTSISRVLVGITGPDPATATLLFKVCLGAVALGMAWLVHWFVKRLTGNQGMAVAAGVLVAWQPNLIVESTGLAHNDPVMMLLSALGMMLAILGGTRAVRGGVVLVTLSALVKYTSLPLLGILGLARLADRHGRDGTRRILQSWLLDGAAIVAVLVSAFAAYWAGTKTLKEMILEPGRLFSSPLYLYPKVGIEHLGPNSIANRFETIASSLVQFLVIAAILVIVARFGRQVWNQPAAEASQPTGPPTWTRPALVAWALIMSTMALAPVNSHPWYWTWPVVPVAILVCYDGGTSIANSPSIPKWVWVYIAVTGVMTIAYHTRIVHP